MTIQLQRRKRKKKDSIVFVGVHEWEEKNEETKEEIERRILSYMRDHIGKENAGTPYELFTHVYKKSPKQFDQYKALYNWTVLKKIASLLRTQNRCFIILRSQQVYVLKTEEELQSYKKFADARIDAWKVSKRNANEWVKTQKWRRF